MLIFLKGSKAMANKGSFSPQGQDSAGGPSVYLGTDADPDQYFVVGAYANVNNINTKNRPLRIYSNTSANPINLKIENLPKASTAPAGTEFASIVIDKATGQLYILG